MRRSGFFVGVVALVFGMGATCDDCNGVTPTDTSAGALDLELSIVETINDGRAVIAVSFDFEGENASFDARGDVVCNGEPIDDVFVANQVYTKNIEAPGPSGAYTCIYREGSADEGTVVVAVDRPVVQYPTAGALVSLNEDLVVLYDAGTGAAVSGEAWRETSRESGAPQSQPDDGSYSFGPLGVGVGEGGIELVREVETTLTGTDFKSVQLSADFATAIDVTWGP